MFISEVNERYCSGSASQCQRDKTSQIGSVYAFRKTRKISHVIGIYVNEVLLPTGMNIRL